MGNPEGNKEREGFADAINRAAFGNERVLLRRRGRAVAEGNYRIINAIREKDLIVLAVKSSVRREVSRV